MPNWVYRDVESGIEGAVDLDKVYHIDWDEQSLEIRCVARSELVHEPARDDLVGPERDIKYRHDDEVTWFCASAEELGKAVAALLKYLGAKRIAAGKAAPRAARPRRP
jgi:hypothetical protein